MKLLINFLNRIEKVWRKLTFVNIWPVGKNVIMTSSSWCHFQNIQYKYTFFSCLTWWTLSLLLKQWFILTCHWMLMSFWYWLHVTTECINFFLVLYFHIFDSIMCNIFFTQHRFIKKSLGMRREIRFNLLNNLNPIMCHQIIQNKQTPC